MISRNGIIYDLKLSWYVFPLNNITYYFSSKNHLEKFAELVEGNRDAYSTSLTKRFKILSNIDNLADLLLYMKVETRGFYIKINGEECVCPNDIIFGGGKVMLKRSETL